MKGHDLRHDLGTGVLTGWENPSGKVISSPEWWLVFKMGIHFIDALLYWPKHILEVEPCGHGWAGLKE